MRRRAFLWLLVGAPFFSRAVAAGSPEPTSLPNLSRIRPFVLERDGGFHVLADLSPIWSEIQQVAAIDARKRFLAGCALILVRRDAVAKYPAAASFKVRLVKVVEYDNYNRPILATAKPLVEGTITTASLPAEGSPEALMKAASATVNRLSFTNANLQ